MHKKLKAKKMLIAKSAEEFKNIFDKFRTEYPNSEMNAISSYRVLKRFIDDGKIRVL